ncbi:MAG: potassium transporter Trk [Microbacterium sp.]|uniref:potassium transporter Trk n=1 Tax=Microbacterium sp. TaxID=51671 RepID=UPI0039E50FFC
MVDQADAPRTEDPSAPHESVEVVSDEIVGARVRRSPRYSVFLVLGAALGVFVAMILTFAFDGNAHTAANGAVYSDGQVFGFLALVGVATGLLVGGLVAVVLDRLVGRRTTAVDVDHEHVERLD